MIARGSQGNRAQGRRRIGGRSRILIERGGKRSAIDQKARLPSIGIRLVRKLHAVGARWNVGQRELHPPTGAGRVQGDARAAAGISIRIIGRGYAAGGARECFGFKRERLRRSDTAKHKCRNKNEQRRSSTTEGGRRRAMRGRRTGCVICDDYHGRKNRQMLRHRSAGGKQGQANRSSLLPPDRHAHRSMAQIERQNVESVFLEINLRYYLTNNIL